MALSVNSYPFTEDVNDGLSYMKTRVPSWCDRILLSHSAKDVLSPVSFSHFVSPGLLAGRFYVVVMMKGEENISRTIQKRSGAKMHVREVNHFLR